ncbi:hypothetical protein FA13DRAFT_1757029 [Coprinellus micaceus]|uniref:LysM domain-containing protein n=1 Tax=Coprinellus micaceus TaxID=71717 RepID=A0A4Y7SNQ8_COPMI|nr:hypothetical protein FA13DRAFT_1757029 [Coprinellus micaceus]
MAALSGALPQTETPTCARTYTVQSGDWCDKISAEQNSSTYQLAQANVGVINADCSNLWVGQVICLGLTGQDCTETVVVEEGGDCTAIATAAGITYEKIRANNPNIDTACTNIYPGEVLCVAA